LCQHNSISHNESLKPEFQDKFPVYCKTVANSGCLLSSDQVELTIVKLKTGKAPGVDGVMAKHVLYSHKSISLHLLILFTAIIVHKYVSSEFGIGRTVPLLKTNL